MADREKLIDLLCKAHSKAIDEILSDDISYAQQLEIEADHLLANGVTFTQAVPGPSEADPNIMELCFHNGERHMKEKVGKELARLAEHMPCITLAQALAMLEGL